MTPRNTTSQLDRYQAAIVLVRILVGWVFLTEGIQKFLFPAELGVGRFAKIGILAPQVMAPFVGGVEIVFGALILLGLFTRLATVPLLIDIVVALFTTKLQFLVSHGVWLLFTRRERMSLCSSVSSFC
jgi:putative oxidoreductase